METTMICSTRQLTDSSESNPMDSITRTLCTQAQAGDRRAYDQLFALHKERALLFIRARLGPHMRAKVESMDILQDAYLAAHKGFDQFEYADDGSFLRWLCRIIENRIRDANAYFGAQKRQHIDLPQSDPTGPVTAFERTQNRAQVLAALDRMNDDYRQVLLLRYFEGCSAEEAGRLMQRSPGAIRNLTSRALVELGKRL
jgi:RNA polymerase sigma-70 factor (ECF subfamily)